MNLIHMVGLLLAFASTNAFAEATLSQFSLGVGRSTILVEKAPGNEFEGVKTYQLGGPSVLGGVSVYQDDRWTSRVLGNLVLDINSSSVLRYGISSSIGYLIMGGPIARLERHESATMTSYYPFCLEVIFQPSFNRYAFPDVSSDRPEPLNATVLETAIGIEFTKMVWGSSAIGAEALVSLKSFFVSGDKISLQSLDLLFSWHTSI